MTSTNKSEISTTDRRRFVQLAIAGLIGIIGQPGCTASNDGKAADKPALIPMLGADRVREIGARYRAMTPAEASASALRDALSSSRGFRLPIGNHPIDDDIHDDFVAGRTVLVNGWVLSLTEARQCALFSLTV